MLMTKNINWRLTTIRLWMLTIVFCGPLLLGSMLNRVGKLYWAAPLPLRGGERLRMITHSDQH